MAAITAAVVKMLLLLLECNHYVAGNHDEEQANDIESLSILTSHSLATRSEWAPELEPCNTTSCAPWFQCQEGKCQPGPPLPLDVLSSDNKLVWECNCVTYVNRTVEVGRCIFNCLTINNNGIPFKELPRNVSKLNVMFCDRFNRQGTLCGQCKDGHFPLAYSFDFTCVKCPQSKTNWIKYVLVAFLPLTAFYFVILLFKVNIASSHLYGFVLYGQAISFPLLARFLVMGFQSKPKYSIPVKILATLYGIWNLDFFRMFDLGICLETSTLFILSLDLIVAVYPLLLMMVTYLMITLHDRHFRLVVVMWSPFRRIFSLFRDKWDIRSSVIDSFATFFLLSNVKFLSVAYDLLIPVKVYRLPSSGNFTHSWRLYHNGTTDYFGSTHLPYAILAIVVLVVFVLLPVLILMLYPFRWFQKILNVLPVRWHVLHTFMDSFQGCYKDGTEPGTRDCRWFASFSFIVRCILFLLASLVHDGSYFPIGCIALTLLALSVYLLNPFKVRVCHYTDIYTKYVILLTMLYLSLMATQFTSTSIIASVFLFVSQFLACLPLLYTFIIRMVRCGRFGLEVFRRWHVGRQGYHHLQ